VAKAKRRLARLEAQLVRLHPQLNDPSSAIRSGLVHVNGVVVRNPDSFVPLGASIVVREPPSLRGEAKLAAALEAFTVPVAGRMALDVGAAAGGFTRVLLEAGARRVYAVDAGYGQLVGSLRQVPRVINLEGVNLGVLDRELVPDRIEVITIDLSYLSLARAVPQLEGLDIALDANLVALVKPMFELGLPRPPTDPPTLRRAVDVAIEGIEVCPWRLTDRIESPVRGRRGALEFFVHAQRVRKERKSEEPGRG
jgi:23S rRNA (cytidine1920-2'-O)/16S rRNA (cytidine1409-2'-O)-methyltransferase